MIVPGSANALFLAASNRRYLINQSLRFRASNSAFLSRTPGGASDQRTWSFSAWIKRGTIGAQQTILSAGTTNRFAIFFDVTTGQISVDGAGAIQRASNALYRDPSSHYHVLVVLNTPDGTAQNRLRVYINGAEITSWATNAAISLNQQFDINSAVSHNIGRDTNTGTRFFDGYLSEVHFIDGQALTPSSFGQTDPATNSWVPRRYTGTYGANGFYLPFNDATSTTTIGQDRSGNGNNWTSSGISVTAGVTFDQMLDSPTNNFATLNPIVDATTFGGAPGISAANLNSTGQAAGTIIPTFAMTTGKWYMEVVSTFSTGNHYFGVRRLSTPPTAAPWDQMIASIQSGGWMDGAGNFTASGAATWSSGDTLGLTWDADAGTLTIRVNNVQEWTYTVAGWAGVPVVFAYSPAAPTGQSQVWNFGQRPFAYTPPTGFLALNTANLGVPNIIRGDMAAASRVRQGSNSTTVVTGYSFAPNLVWVKNRTVSSDHRLMDTVRGTSDSLSSNTTNGTSGTGYLTTFSSNGYTLSGNLQDTNQDTHNYVDWVWRSGPAYGFDIVGYTGNNTSDRNISHALNVAPHFAVVKSRSSSNWWAWHRNLSGNTSFLTLNGTGAQTTTNTPWGTGNWSSSQFMVTNNATENANANSTNYISYLWTSIPGFSLFGSYTGNGSADGPFVWCGFRPRFVMVKRADTTGDWFVWDTARNAFNVVNLELLANTAGAEVTATDLDINSNGFKVRNTTAGFNASGGTYIFAAFAETPFKFANAR